MAKTEDQWDRSGDCAEERLGTFLNWLDERAANERKANVLKRRIEHLERELAKRENP